MCFLFLWKVRYCCNSKYKVKTANLNKIFKEIKHNTVNGDSTDEDIINEEEARIFGPQDNLESEGNPILASEVNSFAEDFENSDDDAMEFEEANVEEAEDRLQNFKHKKGN